VLSNDQTRGSYDVKQNQAKDSMTFNHLMVRLLADMVDDGSDSDSDEKDLEDARLKSNILFSKNNNKFLAELS